MALLGDLRCCWTSIWADTAAFTCCWTIVVLDLDLRARCEEDDERNCTLVDKILDDGFAAVAVAVAAALLELDLNFDVGCPSTCKDGLVRRRCLEDDN